MAPTNPTPPIAIVGMALRLPGEISTVSDFWKLMVNKQDSQSQIPGDRYNIEAFYGGTSQTQAVATDRGYFLQGVNLKAFDLDFFSMRERDVELLDPQQRLLLEVVWECMESAGQTNWRGSNIGCFVGLFGEDWQHMLNMDTHAKGRLRVDGTEHFFTSNRVSMEYNLKGPCMTLQTACSSSMYALHEACQALHNDECSAAIVAGSNLILDPSKTVALTDRGVLSPTGSCKTFDASADGYARGEAINAVLVKRLDDAIRDGDPIRAIIRSTAVSHDGKPIRPGVPRVEGQEHLMRKAYELADLEISRTPFIECHGTGTIVGDKIETAAVARVFGERGVYIGAIKPSLGHSEAASGLTSIIKAVLALEHNIIPPNIRFSNPHPNIISPMLKGNLQVPVEPIPWPKDRHARVSVNSFGIGGSNAHVILDSAASFLASLSEKNSIAANENENTSDPIEKWPHLLPVSANNAYSLQLRTQSLQQYIQSRPESISEAAYTLSYRRDHLPYRSFGLATDDTWPLQFETHRQSFVSAPEVVFVFGGQGSQWVGMGKDLVENSSNFCDAIREMDTALQTLAKPSPRWKIETLLCSGEADLIREAEISQSLCTAIQIALVNSLDLFGIKASAIVGHSSGEIAGAYAAGALTASEAILCAYYRGLSARQTRLGAMAAVGLGENAISPFLTDAVTIACVNSPTNVTISGDSDILDEVLQAIIKSDPAIFTRRLEVDIAYHSDYMKEVGESYEQKLNEVLSGKRPIIPFYSCVTGKRAADDVKFGPSYWRQSLESCVLFDSSVQEMLNESTKSHVLLEIGPHAALKVPLFEIAKRRDGSQPVYASTLTKGSASSMATLLKAVGQLFLCGYPVNLSSINPPSPVLTDLPNYPWDHRREFWKESRVSLSWRYKKHLHHPLLGSLCLEGSDLEPMWRNCFTVSDLPWLLDHKIADDIIFPCAGYMAIMGEVIRQMTDSDTYQLRNLFIKHPLLLLESTQIEIMTTAKPSRLTDHTNSSWHDISIMSFDGTTWIQHCTAQGKSGVDYLPPQRRIDVYTRHVSEAFWYKNLRHSGLNYGPRFQGLSSISAHTKQTKATASVRNDTEYASTKSLHPTTIDMCLQLLTVALTKGLSHSRQASTIPISVGHVYAKYNGNGLLAHAATDTNAKGVLTGEVRATSMNNCVLFEVENMVLANLEHDGGDDGVDTIAAARLHWRPDIDFMSPNKLLRPGTSNKTMLQLLESISAISILETLNTISSLKIATNHLARYASWLQLEQDCMSRGDWEHLVPEAAVWATLTIEARQDVRTALIADLERQEDPNALRLSHLYHKLFNASNIKRIFLGEITLTELLADDQHPGDLYTICQEITDSFEFFSLCAHSQPALRVLEIGAGTATTAQDVLKSLTSKDGTKMYSNYTFTDISMAPFAAAKKRLGHFSQVEYKILDISKDPARQGFDPGSFDLIIACNVLHTTPSLSGSLRNIRKLLRPGGRLFLQEPILPSQLRFLRTIMGFFPQWWSGDQDNRQDDPRVTAERWNLELRAAGFSGTGDAVPDNETCDQVSTTIISTAVETVVNDSPVTILYKDEKSTFATELAMRLESYGRDVHWCTLSDHKQVIDQDIISTIDLTSPFLNEISSEDYDRLISWLAKLKVGVLWLTRSAQIGCQDPGHGLILGLARTIRTELSLEFATLELECLDSNSVDLTINVFQKFQRRLSSKDLGTEYEYAVFKSVIYISRYRWTPASKELNSTSPQNGPRILSIHRRGFLDSLNWVNNKLSRLGSDDVELETRAVGLNFRDVLLAMGVIQGPKDNFGNEMSGIVTRIGSEVHGVKVGDRVMALGADCFASSKIIHNQRVIRIPDSISFEEAATIPVVYCTAIHSLISVGQLTEGQSVLIHAACGGVGLAALQICKMLKAQIYATVGSEDKVKHLMNVHGLPRDRIFHSRDDSFVRGILLATEGRGVDLVLNSLSGELLHGSWKCVAKYGRMVEIGKRDFIGKGHLMLDPFEDNRTFHGVDLVGLSQDRPQVIRKLMEQFVQYYQQGHITPALPIKVFSAQKVADAFRYMQNGQHIGKIAINMQEASQVPVTMSKRDVVFSNQSTYLMVGGLGGLGRLLATWMVERGARSIVFLSRSAGKSKEDDDFFGELESQGCIAIAIEGSVAVMSDVERAVSAAPTPISGVIHMPLVLKDQSILQMKHADWKLVQEPKVRGTWNLHATLSGSDLDFFILLSSIAGTAGQPGQANYASANTFMDSFVQYRHQHNLPCSVIDLGAMDGVGYLSRNSEVMKQLSDASWHMLQPWDFLDAVEIAIDQSPPCVKISEQHSEFCNTSQLAIGLRSSRPISDPGNYLTWKGDLRMGLYRQLEVTADPKSSLSDDKTHQLLQAAAADAQVLKQPATLELVTGLIGRTLASYTQQTPENMDPTAPIASIGIDSLVSIEFRNWLRRNLGINISVLEIVTAGTIEQLGKLAVDSLREKHGVGKNAK